MKDLFNKYRNISLPAKASLWFVICSLIQKGVAFFTTPFFTRLMSTSAYGTIVLYSSWMEIISIIVTLQLSTGVFNKAMIKYENHRDAYTSSCLFLVSCLTVFWLLTYLATSSFWNSILGLPKRLVVMMFLDVFFSSAMSFWSIRNRFEYQYKNVIVFTLLANILGPITSIILLINVSVGKEAEAKVFGILVIKILVYSVVYIMIMKKGKKIIAPDYWKYAVLYNLPLIPHYLSQQVLTQSDRIMINGICGSSDAGVYGVAYQLSMAILIVTIAIHNSFTPWTFECMRDKKYDNIGKIAIQLELIIGIACFCFSLFAPELIYILGGEKYTAAVWIVPPVAMSVLFQTIYTFFGNIEFYFEKTKLVMLASLIVAAANIILNAIFIPIFGFVAAGYTTLICYILYSIVHYLFMLRICKQEGIHKIYNGKFMWSIGFLCVILSLTASLLFRYKYIRYMVIALLTVIFLCLGKRYKEYIFRYLKK